MTNICQGDKVRYRSSVETDLKILKILALEKKFDQYGMPNRIGKNYRTVLRHIKSLRKRGFIQLVRAERSMKGGKDRNVFGITLSGLLYVFYLKDTWKDIDTIAEKHVDRLPMIFGKWGFFVEKGVKDEVVERLKGAVLEMDLDKVRFIESLERERPEQILEGGWFKRLVNLPTRTVEETRYKHEAIEAVKRSIEPARQIIESIRTIQRDPRQELTNIVFLGLVKWRVPLEEQAKFMSILKDDADLDRYIKEQLEELEKEYANYLNNIKSLEEWWNSLGK